jgi:hypothetical protein
MEKYKNNIKHKPFSLYIFLTNMTSVSYKLVVYERVAWDIR